MARDMQDLEYKYTRQLTKEQILAAFPEEARDLVRTQIKKIDRELGPFFEQIKQLKKKTTDKELNAFMILVIKEIYMPKKKVEHWSNLKAMERLMCKTTRGVTDDDIAKAKDVDIFSLYDFRKKLGKSACCPFHDDQNASFAVRNNRWICFAGCGKGDSIDFYMKLNNIPFYQAVQRMVNL